MKKLISLTAVLCLAAMLLTSCAATVQQQPASSQNTSSSSTASTAAPQQAAEVQKFEKKTTVDPAALGDKVNIEIEMTDGNVIKAELYPKIAPETVANFVELCQGNFYDGLIFHRVIPGFMIQGGCFDENGVPHETDSIKGEFTANGFENDLKHTRGVLSMARATDPDSASSQFFIMHADYPSLDGQYAAFGMVTEGLEEVDKIASVQTTDLNAAFRDVPVEPQVIKTIRVAE